jgi:hypothetical protein
MHKYEIKIWDHDLATDKIVSQRILLDEGYLNALKWELTHSSAYFSKMLAYEIAQKEKEFETEWNKVVSQ